MKQKTDDNTAENLKTVPTMSDKKQTGLPYNADKAVPTICCCGDACGMNHLAQAYVKDGRIVYYDGCKEAPNKGALCARGAAGLDIINDPNRIKYPMKRINAKGEKGKFQRITWDEAFDTIATGVAKAIEDVGPHAVNMQFGHTGDMAFLAGSPAMTSRFGFDSAVGPFGCWSDQIVGGWVTLGDYYHWHAADLHHTNLIVIWGENSALTKPSEWAEMREAKEKHGAKIIVIDPRFTETAEKADLYLPLRPGTDAALALGMANVIITEGLADETFIAKYTTGYEEYKQLALQYPPEKVEEITWCPADRIRTAARLYATTKPALIQMGRGGNYSAGTGSNAGWLAARGVSCLIGLCGQAGVSGSGYSCEASGPTPHSGFFHFPMITFFGPVVGKPLVPRTVPKPIGVWEGTERLYDRKPYGYEVFWTHMNSASSHNDQNKACEAFAKIPLVIMQNRLINWTASQFADLLLPSCTWAEKWVLRFDWEGLFVTEPAIEPMYESKPDTDILRGAALAIAKKLGLTASEQEVFPFANHEAFIDAIVKAMAPGWTAKEAAKHPEGIRPKEWYAVRKGFVPYKAKHYVENPVDPEEIYFPTQGGTGKLEFSSPWLKETLNLPELPIPDEPMESPLRTPEVWKEYPFISHTRVARFWQFLNFNQASDGGPSAKVLREAFKDAKEPLIEISPAAGAKFGLKEGDMAWVESQHAKFKAKLQFSRRLPDWMVVTPKHWGAVQNRITPPGMSLGPAIAGTLKNVGPYPAIPAPLPMGGQPIHAGILCKVYKCL
jgi:anaerobic selenocysteine-containing dehydrogenase